MKKNSLSVGIINLAVSNIFSVYEGCKKAGYKVEVINKKKNKFHHDIIIVPGVGSFKSGMKFVYENNLDEKIKDYLLKPNSLVYGICLGMQLLFEESYEFGHEEGLALVKGKVDKIPIKSDEKLLKIPSIGWNELVIKKKDKLFANVESKNSTYFVHSYMAIPENKSIVTSVYKFGELEVVASVSQDNIFGCQFHPEKSGKVGLGILKNFISDEI